MLIPFGLSGRLTGQTLPRGSYVRTHVTAGLIHVQSAPAEYAMDLGSAIDGCRWGFSASSRARDPGNEDDSRKSGTSTSFDENRDERVQIPIHLSYT
jgi:hypothetical protein